MALLQSVKGSVVKSRANILKICSVFVHSNADVKEDLLKEIQTKRKVEDMPVEMENPYSKEKPKCILCKLDIEPNFKNIRLLSQFMSHYTGRVYGRHITGLCEHKQKRVEVEIKRAQQAGLLGVRTKDPNFLSDPDLYDPSKPFRAL